MTYQKHLIAHTGCLSLNWMLMVLYLSLSLIENYLSNRKQKVRIKKTLSVIFVILIIIVISAYLLSQDLINDLFLWFKSNQLAVIPASFQVIFPGAKAVVEFRVKFQESYLNFMYKSCSEDKCTRTDSAFLSVRVLKSIPCFIFCTLI